MPRIKLTEDRISKLTAERGQQFHWDTVTRGFGVCVSPTSKSFYAQKRLKGVGSRREVIGAVGMFSLEQARLKAIQWLARVSDGEDPRRPPIATWTLKDWLDFYLDRNNRLNEPGKKQYRFFIETYLPRWLGLTLHRITPEMVEDRHPKIAREVASRRKGRFSGQTTANSVMRYFRAVWNFAQDRDATLPSCPTKRFKRGGWYPRRKRRGMVPAEHLREFYRAVLELSDPDSSAYILLLLFTGLRRGSAACLRWDYDPEHCWVDFGLRTIRFPESMTKNETSFELPMSDLVYELLNARSRSSGWVFPGRHRGTHLKDTRGSFKEISRAIGLKITPHDLRRTFTTIAEKSGISVLEIKALVNHKMPDEQTADYVILNHTELTEAAQKVADKIKTLCGIVDGYPRLIADRPRKRASTIRRNEMIETLMAQLPKQ
jgi:integrase